MPPPRPTCVRRGGVAQARAPHPPRSAVSASGARRRSAVSGRSARRSARVRGRCGAGHFSAARLAAAPARLARAHAGHQVRGGRRRVSARRGGSGGQGAAPGTRAGHAAPGRGRGGGGDAHKREGCGAPARRLPNSRRPLNPVVRSRASRDWARAKAGWGGVPAGPGAWASPRPT